jgi:hypothetical protein
VQYQNRDTKDLRIHKIKVDISSIQNTFCERFEIINNGHINLHFGNVP